MKGYSFSTPAVAGYCFPPGDGGMDFAVNGSKDERLDKRHAIDWRVHEATVVRLRRRIFTATREQD